MLGLHHYGIRHLYETPAPIVEGDAATLPLDPVEVAGSCQVSGIVKKTRFAFTRRALELILTLPIFMTLLITPELPILYGLKVAEKYCGSDPSTHEAQLVAAKLLGDADRVGLLCFA